MSTLRRRADAGKADRSKLPRGPKGNVLCRLCGEETDSPRKNFCGPGCVHNWRLQTSASYARQCVRKRDKGVCAQCKTDTYSISRGIRRPLLGETKAEWKKRIKAVRKKYGIPAHRKTFWDLDHIRPVAEGGGLCGLDNMRTLCIPCHQEVTNALRQRLREAKKT